MTVITDQPIPPELELLLAEWRCKRCNRKQSRILLSPGSAMETKCYSCNMMNVVWAPKSA